MTVLWVSGRYLEIVWRVSVDCLEGVLWMSGMCLEGVLRVSGGYLWDANPTQLQLVGVGVEIVFPREGRRKNPHLSSSS